MYGLIGLFPNEQYLISGTGFKEYSTYWCFFKSLSCSSKVKPVRLAIRFACNKEYTDVNKSPQTTTMTSAYHFQKIQPRIPTRMIKANSSPPIMRAFFLAANMSSTTFFSFITSVLFRIYGQVSLDKFFHLGFNGCPDFVQIRCYPNNSPCCPCRGPCNFYRFSCWIYRLFERYIN